MSDYVEIEGEPDVSIVLSAAKPVPALFVEDLKQIVYDVQGENTQVAVFIVQDALARPVIDDEKTSKIIDNETE